jgi:phenylpropionate dioxygenase-like ring-hydroxylating dioxygenase large terminal subunit
MTLIEGHAIAARREPDWGRLIEQDRVHGSLYTDANVFEIELDRIWRQGWVFIGHTSEIPNANDFVMKSIGPEPLIMARGRDGDVHLLFNRCTHRGAEVCGVQRGNAATFTCPFHGWKFSSTGQLLGYPFSSGYGGRELKDQLGLARVARVADVHGFVFGSMAEDGPSLREHLGAAVEVFERLVRLSPSGEVAVTADWLHHSVRANWKLVVENETDGYHPQFVHASIFDVADSGIGRLYGERSTATARYLGGGHTENDLRSEFRRADQPLGWFGTSPDRVPDYVAQMEASYGDAAREILVDGSPHVMVWPNLFIAEIQLFVIQPLAVDATVQHVTAVQYPGCPDMNRRMLQQTIGSVGPAGFLLADDSDLYERNQRGLQASQPEWLVIKRGLHRERLDDEGFLVGDATDEVTMRGLWRHYRSIMEAGA